MSAPVSVCIIACNEEDQIGRCLEALSWADECIVVVDSRSNDATERLARESGARVVIHPYEGNVEQKNFALGCAKHDWVLGVDADEVLSDALQQEIVEVLKTSAPSVGGFELNRVTYHLGRWIRHGDFYPDWQLRLFRRSRGRYVGINPHGRAEVDGPVGRLRNEMFHYSYRDLADQVDRVQDFSRVQARALERSGRTVRLADLCLRPPFRFLRAYVLKQGFRDGMPGLIIAAVTAFHVFLKYAKLWELQRGGGREDAAGKVRRRSADPR